MIKTITSANFTAEIDFDDYAMENTQTVKDRRESEYENASSRVYLFVIHDAKGQVIGGQTNIESMSDAIIQAKAALASAETAD